MAKSGHAIIMARRRKEVLKLKESGLSLRAIADRLNEQGTKCSYGTVKNDLKIGLAMYNKEIIDHAAGYVALEVARCEKMINAFWSKSEEGDEKAAAIVDKFMDRKEKLLGLFAPEKKEVKHSNDEPLEVVFVSCDAEPSQDSE